jgi:NAD(P) transhydrogenase subunit alpha
MTKDGEVVPDFSDEVVAGTCLTHRGGIVHAQTALGMGEPAADPTPSESPPEKPRVTPPETPAAPTEGAAS